MTLRQIKILVAIGLCFSLIYFGLNFFIDKPPRYILQDEYPDARFSKTMIKKGFQISLQENPNLDLSSKSNLDSILLAEVKPLSNKRGPNQSRIWQLSKNQNLPSYILEMTEWITQSGCQILTVNEVSPYNNTKAQLSYQCTQKPVVLNLEISNQFKENSSSLAVVFAVQGMIEPKILTLLDSLDRHYALVVNPFDLDSSFKTDFARLANPEVYTYVPLEDFEDMDISLETKRNLIKFYNSPSDVETRLKDIIKRVPMTQGYLSMGGRRALGSPDIRRAVLQYISNANLSYLNTVQSRTFSMTQACQENQTSCVEVNNCTDSSKFPVQKCIEDNMLKASKTSRNIILLPLTESAMNLLQMSLQKYSDKGIKLSNIFELSKQNP